MAFALAISALVFAEEPFPTHQLSPPNIITTDKNIEASANAGKKKFKSEFSNLYIQLEDLHGQSKALESQINTKTQDIKNQWEGIKKALGGDKNKAGRKGLKDKREKIEPVRNQIETTLVEVKALNTQIARARSDEKDAVKARDEKKASTALTSIIGLENQVIEKKKSVLKLKQQILELIES